MTTKRRFWKAMQLTVLMAEVGALREAPEATCTGQYSLPEG